MAINIGVWCNGSIRGSNPLGQGSNPWAPVSEKTIRTSQQTKNNTS